MDGDEDEVEIDEVERERWWVQAIEAWGCSLEVVVAGGVGMGRMYWSRSWSGGGRGWRCCCSCCVSGVGER